MKNYNLIVFIMTFFVNCISIAQTSPNTNVSPSFLKISPALVKSTIKKQQTFSKKKIDDFLETTKSITHLPFNDYGHEPKTTEYEFPPWMKSFFHSLNYIIPDKFIGWNLKATNEPTFLAGIHVRSKTIFFEVRFFEFLMEKYGEEAPILIRAILAHEVSHYIDVLAKEITGKSIQGLDSYEGKLYEKTKEPNKGALELKITAALSHAEVDYIGYYIMEQRGYIIPQHLMDALLNYINKYPFPEEEEEVFQWQKDVWNFQLYLRYKIATDYPYSSSLAL